LRTTTKLKIKSITMQACSNNLHWRGTGATGRLPFLKLD
jgi:hypothetical protein